MRPIDADALETKIQILLCEVQKHGFTPPEQIANLGLLLQYINKAPTIGAKPVVHAHWKEWYTPKEFIMTGEEKLYICSNCDAKYSDVENQRFCPWCGAQMDELVSKTDELDSSEKPNSCDHIAKAGKKENNDA